MMQLIEFKLFDTSMPVDHLYNDGYACFRVYEYKIVLNLIKKLSTVDSPSIHNSSWGFEGVHIIFKNKLDKLSSNCIHSDIKWSKLHKTTIYDITNPPPTEYLNKFDFVLNISTVEEVYFDHWIIIQNLFAQVKENGYLIITFDYPGMNVPLIEKHLGVNLEYPSGILLNGNTSELANSNYGHLNCGLLVIKKVCE